MGPSSELFPAVRAGFACDLTTPDARRTAPSPSCPGTSGCSHRSARDSHFSEGQRLEFFGTIAQLALCGLKTMIPLSADQLHLPPFLLDLMPLPFRPGAQVVFPLHSQRAHEHLAARRHKDPQA